MIPNFRNRVDSALQARREAKDALNNIEEKLDIIDVCFPLAKYRDDLTEIRRLLCEVHCRLSDVIRDALLMLDEEICKREAPTQKGEQK